MNRCDIVVVGGGPVGAAAALTLARTGFSVALVERGTSPPAFDAAIYSSRVYALSPASMRLLAQHDVWSKIVAQRACAYGAMRVWVDAPDRGMRFTAQQLALSELGWIVEHPLLVDAVWRALPDAGVAVETGVGDVTWTPCEAGGCVHLADGRALEAALVVAADGANSGLRRAAGIEVASWGYAQRAIVCNVSAEQPHRHTAWQRFLPSGPLALLPLADGRLSIVWSADDTRAEELLALDDAAFSAELSAAAQIFGAVSEPTPRVGFPLQLLHAEAYACPGLVLVGDAAHTVHPLAGQGVNLGLADVAALCTTLSEARNAGRDWADLRTLGRYARARRAGNLEMLTITDVLQKAFGARVPGLRTALGAGIQAVDVLTPLKAWLGAQAVA